MSDIGAISPGRWQYAQFLKKMGATSFEKVTTAAELEMALALLPENPNVTSNTTSVELANNRKLLVIDF